MKSIYTALLLLLSLSLQAQHKPENRILASFGPQCYFNKNNPIEQSGANAFIANPIRAKNTVCTYLRLGYERTTRYGLTFGAGLVGGSYKYDITFYRDFSDFDPRAARVLKGFIYDSTFRATNWYIAPEVTVGYRYNLNKKWTLSGKAGAFLKYKLTNKDFTPTNTVLPVITYPTDDNSLIVSVIPTIRYNVFEHVTNTKVAHIYIGAEHITSYQYLHHFTFGLDFTHNVSYPLNAYTNNWETVSAFQREEGIAHEYRGRDFTIALCLGVSLWP